MMFSSENSKQTLSNQQGYHSAALQLNNQNFGFLSYGLDLIYFTPNILNMNSIMTSKISPKSDPFLNVLPETQIITQTSMIPILLISSNYNSQQSIFDSSYFLIYLLQRKMINKKIDQGPVLLVCVYNRFGNIITHDYLYQLFVPFGEIVKILIFQKAKVWKTFIEFKQSQSAVDALFHLNNKVIFQDGSKMNIFHSKLRHVEFQNDNLGGVNYENLKSIQQIGHSPLQQQLGIRKRNNTFQDYYSQVHQSQSSQFANFYYFDQSKTTSKMPYFTLEQHNLYSFQPAQSTFQKSQSLKPHYPMENSDSTFHKSQTVNSKNSFGGSLNNFGGIDDLFRQIALQSNEYREWQQSKNRKKAKTLVNPYSEQFLIENCPSKVIFIRSIPQNYSHQCLYNIFVNFGNISRMIFMKDKASALIQFEQIYEAIRAKDQINYVKCDLKIFYSHYESLVLRKDCEDELILDYSNKSVKNSASNLSSVSNSKKKTFNPPSQTLYLTMITPFFQNQLKKKCLEIGCKVKNIEWKQNGKDKWMGLIQFKNINDSLQALGMLQNEVMSNGKRMKLSFTRSKISSCSHVKEQCSSQMFYVLEQGQLNGDENMQKFQ